jgi:primosomal replication protein N
VRRRRSRAEAEQLVREFEGSGLTRQAFCAERGLSVAALDKYRRRLAAASKLTTAGKGRLVAVEVMPVVSAGRSSSALCVELASGRRIAVSSGFDAATLRRLLSVLEQA